MREIARLKTQQGSQQMNPESPALMNELRLLRQRKGELEGHLGALQDSRRQLMVQLEGLMRMLKNQQTSSPRSTPNSSPRSGKSPPLPQQQLTNHQQQQQSTGGQMLGGNPLRTGGPLTNSSQMQQQAIATNNSNQVAITSNMVNVTNQIDSSLNSLGGDVRSAFGTNGAASKLFR